MRLLSYLRRALGSFVRGFVLVRDAPRGCQWLVMYGEPQSRWAMLCYLMPDGSLIPVHRRPHPMNAWTPPKGWVLLNQKPISANASHAANSGTPEVKHNGA